jgi:hypothetical protein
VATREYKRGEMTKRECTGAEACQDRLLATTRAGTVVGMATPAERRAEKRRLALEELERQKADGSLVSRKMTPAERKKYPAKPPREPRKYSR